MSFKILKNSNNVPITYMIFFVFQGYSRRNKRKKNQTKEIHFHQETNGDTCDEKLYNQLAWHNKQHHCKVFTPNISFCLSGYYFQTCKLEQPYTAY